MMSEQRRFGVSEFATNADRFEAYEELCDRLESLLTAEREARQRAESDLLGLKIALQKPSISSGNSVYCDIDKLAEANSILLEELRATESALKLSAAKYNQEAAIKAFVQVKSDELVAHWKQRAEAAEARIKASQEQEPVAWVYTNSMGDSYLDFAPYNCYAEKLYKQPIIPPELSEVMRERDELKRKLAEQQSHNNFDAARLRRLVSFCGVSAPDSDEELLQVAGVVIGSCLRVLQSPSSMIDPHSEIGVLKHHLSCKNSQIEELNRLLSEARKVPEWQPIETAPKGKPGFLATDEELSAIEWLIDDGEDDYFNVNSCNYTKSEHWKFWMPLPASPTYKEQP